MRSDGTEFGLHQSARYIPDLVLRVFPGRKGYPDLPNVEEMDARRHVDKLNPDVQRCTFRNTGLFPSRDTACASDRPARGDTLPCLHIQAALLFADVSGFTPLTKTLQELKGPVRGAEDLNRAPVVPCTASGLPIR